MMAMITNNVFSTFSDLCKEKTLMMLLLGVVCFWTGSIMGRLSFMLRTTGNRNLKNNRRDTDWNFCLEAFFSAQRFLWAEERVIRVQEGWSGENLQGRTRERCPWVTGLRLWKHTVYLHKAGLIYSKNSYRLEVVLTLYNQNRAHLENSFSIPQCLRIYYIL